jgi:hypothetical protein
MAKEPKKVPALKLTLRELAVIQDALQSYADSFYGDMDLSHHMRLHVGEVARINMVLTCFMNVFYPNVSLTESDVVVLEAVGN